MMNLLVTQQTCTHGVQECLENFLCDTWFIHFYTQIGEGIFDRRFERFKDTKENCSSQKQNSSSIEEGFKLHMLLLFIEQNNEFVVRFNLMPIKSTMSHIILKWSLVFGGVEM
jgi:hypothetical protein